MADPKIYVGVGHGRRPDGVFDPGAVHPEDGTREYDVAFDIAVHLVGHLERAGCQVVTETDHGRTLDPNFIGKTQDVNGEHPPFDLAMSVHLDWYRAPRGVMPLYVSQAAKAFGDKVVAAYRDADLPVRGVVRRTDLHFLNRTNVPALLVEADRVGQDAAAESNVKACAAAIARGLLDGFGLPFIPVPSGGEKRPDLNDRKNYVTVGDVGDPVRELQVELARLLPDHEAAHPPDGDFGPKTLELVLAAYQHVGLEAADPNRPRVGPRSMQAFKAADPVRPSAEWRGKAVRSKVDNLAFYRSPGWQSNGNPVAGTFNAGWRFPTIEAKVEVGGGHQYRVRNSRGHGPFYVTASERFVELV